MIRQSGAHASKVHGAHACFDLPEYFDLLECFGVDLESSATIPYMPHRVLDTFRTIRDIVEPF
jgi:hypothetical protein